MSKLHSPAELAFSVAGIPIYHEMGSCFEVEGQSADPVAAEAGCLKPLFVRHAVGSVDTTGMRRKLEVGSHVEYLESESGELAVRLRPFDSALPMQLLRSARAGYEYDVSYEFVPTGPFSRRDTEMAAYTLALAARRHGILAHGCGFILPSGQAALCLGQSGAGKSTLGRMIREQPNVRVLNDDRIVLTREADGFRLWSTPWPGRAGLAVAGDAKLGVIGVLGRGTGCCASRLPPRTALQRMLMTLALPLWEPGEIGFGLDLIDALIATLPVIELSYPLADGVAEWIVDTLTGVLTTGNG